MKKILVPTDFSANAMNALRYAIELARAFDSKITLVHTYEVIKRTDMLVSLEEVIKKDIDREIQALNKKIPEELLADIVVKKGEAVGIISDLAEYGSFDLIVMGTKGASGLRKVFIGSTTGGVMRRSDVPILAIPDNFSYQPIRKIVLALANIKLSGEKVARPLIELANQFGARIDVYHHARESEKTDREKLLETTGWLKDLPHSLFLEEDDDHLNDNIRDFVKSSGADLLCMIRRNRDTIGFFERLFQSSVTLSQVFHCETPLLILHCE